jgi:hypothetical protein
MSGQVQRGSQSESSVRFDSQSLTVSFDPATITHSANVPLLSAKNFVWWSRPKNFGRTSCR